MRTSALLLFLVLAVTARAAEKPNIIVIYADDMGYGDCTANNPDSKIHTPHIDQLAKEGMRFRDAHSPAAVCTPSRYGLLTGINPAREGIVNGLCRFGPVIKNGTPTIASLLKEHGYTTKMVGKWHLGYDVNQNDPNEVDYSKPMTSGPVDRGFDYFYGTDPPGNAPYYYIRNRHVVAAPTETIGPRSDLMEITHRRMGWRGGAAAPGFEPTEVMGSFLKETIKLITDHAAKDKDKPLFVYLALTAPHTPWVPAKEFEGKSGAGLYGDFVMEIDDLVGKVNAALVKNGMEKDTILIFSSDNGALEEPGFKEEYGHSVNAVLRGGKARPYEGGHRVPFLLKWPDVVPPGAVTDATVNHTDMFATLIDILGVKDREQYLISAIDSHSFLPVLKNPDAEFVRPAMFNTNSTCRIGQWKIVAGRRVLQGDALDRRQIELYNLDKDLSETTDVSEENPERLELLVKSYEEFRAEWAIRAGASMRQEVKRQSEGKGTRPPRNDAGKNGKRPNPALRAFLIPEDVQLSEEQKTKVEALVAEYRRRTAELREKLAEVLTDEQAQASAAAKRKAIEDGKKGMALRKAVDAAAKLTDEQKKQIQNLRQEMANVTRECREKLLEMLTDDQRAKLESPGKQ